MKGRSALALFLLYLSAFSTIVYCSNPFFDGELMFQWIPMPEINPLPENMINNILVTSPHIQITETDLAIVSSYSSDHSVPELEWNKTFGGTGSNYGRSIQQTKDRGYIITGGTWGKYGSDNWDFWLIKTDSSGNEIWNKTFDRSSVDRGYSGQETSDGGYIIAGYTFDSGSWRDGWLIKTDSAGTEMWNRTFGGSGDDEAYSVQQTSDDGYIVTGYTKTEKWYGIANVWLIKTDSAGNKLWDQTFGGTEYDCGYSVQQTNDDGYIIAGVTNSYSAGNGDVWLIKTDSAGNKLWDQTFGGKYSEEGYSVQQTKDDGYVIAGFTASFGAGGPDIWLIKTDSEGNEIWNKTFGWEGSDYGYTVQQTSDGGYILSGGTNSHSGGVWLIKTDSEGNSIWDKTFDGITFGGIGYSLQETSDGGIVITGTTSYHTGYTDVFLIKIRAETARYAYAFDYPVGTPRALCGTGYVTQENDGDGWYNRQDWRAYNANYGGYHPGEDWNGEGGGSSDVGAPVYAVANGVVYATTSNVAGEGIAIEHNLPNGESVYSVYIHISIKPGLSAGSVVSQGEKIGTLADITSHGMSPHLHFEIRTKPVNPLDWYPNDLGNGYYGTISLLYEDGFTVDPSDFIDSHRGEVEPPLFIGGYKIDVSTGEHLEGWKIILKDNAGNEIANTLTNSTGYYRFCNLFPGEYEVCEEVKDGWTSAAATCINITLGNENVGVDFFNKPASLAVDIDEAASDSWIDPYSSNADDKEAMIWYDISPEDFSGQLYMKIQDQNGNMYTWDKGLISATGGRHSLTWDGRVASEYVSQPNNPYYISLVLEKDGQEVARSGDHKIWVGRPVILLHGLWSTKEKMETHKIYRDLNTRFYTMAIEYNGGWSNGFGDIKQYALNLSKEIDAIKGYTNAEKVDIVAHSMGGLVARWYIQKWNKNDVGKLIMIGTPNHGSELANFQGYALLLITTKLFGPGGGIAYIEISKYSALNQMMQHSTFMKKLNNNDCCAYQVEKGLECSDEISISSKYVVITSDSRRPTPTHIHVLGLPVPAITAGDGVVPFFSSMLSNVNQWYEGGRYHEDQVESPEVINRVILLLQQPDYQIQSSSMQCEDVIDSDINTAYWTNPIEDVIHPDDAKSYLIFVDPNSLEAHFFVVWDNGSLNVTLSAPNGTEIEMPSEEFFAAYSAQDPEGGNWTIEISPFSIPANGTNVTIQAIIANPLFLGVGTEKTVFDPEEPIKITAYLGDEESPVSNAVVVATITKPDNSVENLTLYDDGLHEDNETGDGIYANEFTNTSLWGTYRIMVSASGETDGSDIERETSTTIWVELYPDLTLDSSDIYFSKNRPVPEEKITISARIHNIGDADAANSSIFFYEGGPATGVLIGEDVINVRGGEMALASASWSAADEGRYKIQVLVSPFNEFLESNYSNNDAFRFIDVAYPRKETPIRRSSRAGMIIQG